MSEEKDIMKSPQNVQCILRDLVLHLCLSVHAKAILFRKDTPSYTSFLENKIGLI